MTETTRLGYARWSKEWEKVHKDSMQYGYAYALKHHRKWWNPLRYIYGELKIKRIDPTKIILQPRNLAPREFV